MTPTSEELVRLAVALGGASMAMTAEEACRGIPGNRCARGLDLTATAFFGVA